MKRILLPTLILLAFCTTVRAETPPTVTTSGEATLKKVASVLKATIELSANGKDIREATAKLKEKRDQFGAKLAELKPAESNISDVAFGTNTQLTAQQRQYQVYYESRSRQAKPTTAPTITVSCVATVSFTLPNGSAEEVLIAAKDLEEKIKTLNPAETKTAATPEEQEVMEEMAAQMGAGAKPGEPTISYAYPLTDQEFASLQADALKQTKQRAEALATAASLKLAGISQISSHTGAASDPYTQIYEMRTGRSMQLTEDKLATGDQATMVTCSVQISATFALQP